MPCRCQKSTLRGFCQVAPNIHLRLMHRIVKVIIYFNEQIRNYSEVSDAEIRIPSIQTQTIEFYCRSVVSIDKVPNLVLGLSAYIIIAMINWLYGSHNALATYRSESVCFVWRLWNKFTRDFRGHRVVFTQSPIVVFQWAIATKCLESPQCGSTGFRLPGSDSDNVTTK